MIRDGWVLVRGVVFRSRLLGLFSVLFFLIIWGLFVFGTKLWSVIIIRVVYEGFLNLVND